MPSARIRTLILAGMAFGLIAALSSRTPPQGEAEAAAELRPLHDLDPDRSPLPPGAVCRIRNAAFQHPQPVHSLSISDDGLTAYTVSDHSTFAWDLSTGALRWRTRGVPEVNERSISARWPVRQIGDVVRVWSWGEGKAGELVELDAATGAVRGRTPLPPPGERLAFPDPTMTRWVDQMPPAGFDNTFATLRDPSGRAPAVALPVHRPEAQHFSRDGKLFLRDGLRIDVFSTETGLPIASFPRPGPRGYWNLVTFTPGSDGLICFADEQSGRELYTLNFDRPAWRSLGRFGALHVGDIRLDPTGRALAIRSGNCWELRDRATGRLKHVFDTQNQYGRGDGEFTPDGRRFVAVHGDRLAVFDAATGEPLGGPIQPAFVRWTKDGRLLVQAGLTVAAYDPRTGRRLGVVAAPHDFMRYHGYQYPAALSAGGTHLAYPTIQRTVAVLDLTTGARAELPTKHVYGPYPRFSPDGRALLLTASNGVRVADLHTGLDTLVRPEEFNHNLWGEAFDISPGGRFITTRRDKLFAPETMRPVPLHGRNLLSGEWAHFTPDGRRLVATVAMYADDPEEDRRIGESALFKCNGPRSETRVGVWELPSGEQVGFYRVPGLTWLPPAMFPDGRSLAYFDTDWNVVVLELATGRERCRFRTDGWFEAKGYDSVTPMLDVSPDGRYLASSLGGSVLVWDVRGERFRYPVPTPAALSGLWRALIEPDGSGGFRAVRALAAHPDVSLPFLRAKAAPPRVPTPAELEGLIVNLDHDDYAVRARASAALVGFGRFAEPALRAAVARAVSPESLRRAADALVGIRRGQVAESLRAVRAVEVAEWVGTPAARELLAAWAGGASGVRFAAEARAALERLERR